MVTCILKSVEGGWENENACGGGMGKLKFRGIVVTLLDQNEFVFNCSMAITHFRHQDFEFVHWPKCSIVLLI